MTVLPGKPATKLKHQQLIGLDREGDVLMEMLGCTFYIQMVAWRSCERGILVQVQMLVLVMVLVRILTVWRGQQECGRSSHPGRALGVAFCRSKEVSSDDSLALRR